MKARTYTIGIIIILAGLCIAGTKLSRLTRTRSIQSTSLFLVSTQATDGRYSSRYIRADDLGTNLSQWISASGGTAGISANASYLNAGGDFANAINGLSNNTILFVSPGAFTLTPSNNTGSCEPFAPARLLNKTNVTIRGSGWGTIIYGTNNPGMCLVLSNCQNVKIEDMMFELGWGLAKSYTSNGLNGVHSTLGIAGSNQFVRLEGLKFQNADTFGISVSYRSPIIDKTTDLQIYNCSASGCGTTNSPSSTFIDGGFFAGEADRLIISGFQVESSVRGFELFTAIGNPYTNMLIANGTISGTTFGVHITTECQGVTVANVVVEGGVTYPGKAGPAFEQTAAEIAVGSGVGVIADLRFDHVTANGITGEAFRIINPGTMISNVTFNRCDVNRGGTPTVFQGGWILNDPANNGVIANVSLLECNLVNLVGDGLRVLGCRGLTVSGCNFIDCANQGARFGISGETGGDVNTNWIIRDCQFKNNNSSFMTYGISIDSTVMNCKMIDNVFTNMGTGNISDASGSSTILGETFSYASVMDLPSIPVSQSFTTNISTPLTRTNWSATVVVPNQLYTSTGSNAVVIAWCSNAVTYVRVCNNDTVTAFDPPSVRYRVFVRQIDSLP